MSDLFGMGGDLFGMKVIESNLLPIDPSPGEVARRIVRHGFGEEFLTWCGAGKVGPKPHDKTHALILGDTIHASASLVGQMRNLATPAPRLGGEREGEGRADG